jgi:DNA polymerase elongation subunit (family B)
MKTDFIPIDYDYFDFRGRNYTKIIGRNSENKRICIIDSCPIYFWAILKDNIKKEKIDNLLKYIRKIKLDVKGRQTKVEKVELHKKKYLSKEVNAIKIFATNYKDLHDIADKLGAKEIEKRRGYDINFMSHYIIEKKINPLQWYEISGEMLNNSEEFGGIDMNLNVDICVKLETIKEIKEKKFLPKILAYDIETDELKIGGGEILMISLVSNNFKKVITWKKIDGKKEDYVEYVEDESELLEKFSDYLKKISPDFLVGYFSDGFDLPYLKARAEKNRVKLSLGLDGSEPKFTRGMTLTGKIKGIVHIDILRFIRTNYSQYMQSETLSLNEVSKEFLGDTKKEFEIKHSSALDEKDWEKYYEYNLHDSVLTYQLFEKIWPDLLEFTKIVQEPVFDVSRNSMSKHVESYIIHNLNRFNEIPEKKPTYDEIGSRKKREKYEGAFVFEPKPGLYENIAMFDFTSMHASIIVSFNISKSTLLEKKEKNSYESPELELSDKKIKFYFSKKPEFFSELLSEIVKLRKKYKKELKEKPDTIKKARSNAFKLLANAYYGYLGFFGARYYSLEAAASTLALVRKFNKETIEKTEKEGYKVVYGDTDSVAFTTEGKTKKEVLSFLKKLNSQLPGIMELELEGFFKRGIWVAKRGAKTGAKKKYALIDEKGKTKIRGFETVRRDWCKLSRNVQNKIIKQILEQGNEKKALKYTKEIIQKIKKREINKENLIIKTQLKKPISEYKSISPHVIAAKKMIEKKIPISEGNLIEYYVAETSEKKKLIRDKVKLPLEKGEYDIEYYLERQILPAVENIFQVFDINIREITEGKKQTTLGDF